MPPTVQASMPKFPGELVDSVIDHLKTDKAALLACSLVSTQWLPRSRQHTFWSVSLFIGWDPKDRKGPARVQEFLSLISSTVVTFVHCVTTIHLWHQRERRKKGSQIISAEEILSRLDTCGIRPMRLSLNSLRHFMRPFSGSPAFASSLVHLDLQLDENHIILCSVVDYICAFPLLESLKIWGIPEEITPLLPKSATLPPKLHTMCAGHPLVANWILSLHPIPKQIATLGLIHFGRLRCRWPEINRYLDSAAAEDIESLVFHGGEPGMSSSTDFMSSSTDFTPN